MFYLTWGQGLTSGRGKGAVSRVGEPGGLQGHLAWAVHGACLTLSLLYFIFYLLFLVRLQANDFSARENSSRF